MRRSIFEHELPPGWRRGLLTEITPDDLRDPVAPNVAFRQQQLDGALGLRQAMQRRRSGSIDRKDHGCRGPPGEAGDPEILAPDFDPPPTVRRPGKRRALPSRRRSACHGAAARNVAIKSSRFPGRSSPRAVPAGRPRNAVMRRARSSFRGRTPAPGLGEPQLRQQARRDGRLGGGENNVLDRVMFDAIAISVRAVGSGIAVGRRRRGGVGRGRLPTRRRVWRIGFFRRAHRRRHGRARGQNQPTGDGRVHGADLIALRQRRSRPGRVRRQKHGAD